MDQVIIKVSGAGLFQLFVEHLIPLLQGVEESVMQFCCQRKAVPGIPVHQRFLGRALAGKPVVHNRCVKVGEAFAHKKVHHLFELFDIHAGSVLRVQGGQSHQAESEFLWFHPVFLAFRFFFHLF